jgi:four helix bundle protein
VRASGDRAIGDLSGGRAVALRRDRRNFNGSAAPHVADSEALEARSLGFRHITPGTLRALYKGMTPQELRARTEAFATAVAEFAEPLFDRFITQNQARQLVRAADAMASNYRAAGRGRSHAEFTAKIGVVLEEADEVEGCLERLRGRGKVDETRRRRLLSESLELVKIFSASAATARRNAEERKKHQRLKRTGNDAAA